ncbi:hypothetical protein N7532_009737 [Penicillium argentinense]|uniref:enoyl-[acyl-carrier-protein] reductase n=1 Tax=Penicillium argentinense TaxID=1131581 RepID=A0A9W9ENC6_9EURO|nr:uncharacterized protein N7532_009737 [Penicillium argentinense]KAJ5084966.1 hypothetical protein N7532_009737 [Penicillium argentinense]
MSAQTVTFRKHSNNPSDVVRVIEYDSRQTELGPEEVCIQFLAAPINPQDLLVIAGKYPVQPAQQCEGEPIPGYDGVARVERIGSAVTNLQPGDQVIPRQHGLGTWRSQAVVPASSLLQVPSSHLDSVSAALLKMGCGPAYLLLQSRQDLRPGDWVVLNAATGVIAQMVIQFARLRGCHSLSIIRDRDDVDSTRKQLLALGADLVVTETELAAQGPVLAAQKRIVLALDAVFGSSGARLAGLLTTGGTYVNYGSLGGATESIGLTQELIFWKQIKFKHFRLSQALAHFSQSQQEDLMTWFCRLFETGSLRTPAVDRVSWETGPSLEATVKQALQTAAPRAKQQVGVRKQVFVFGPGNQRPI